ncbi:hypothetical protein CALVIDRAFT_541710 [Calocera viscosa TUFC12733]|uniref:Uncharacterized protein n=1 Tax=Calocera viscosa (strain TUFC12733) TaxID=1330018 RepID=A0A167HEH7_CALVF|nr:hypothetical protein CALVIDRAFT_541710 [Calocera viscosa TUFC12733]
MASKAVASVQIQVAATLKLLQKALSSDGVDVLLRFLSTASGTDKLFSLIESWTKLFIVYLRLPRPQYSNKHEILIANGVKATTRIWEVYLSGPRTSPLADRLANLTSAIGDSRMLFRFGALPGQYKAVLSLIKSQSRPLIPTLQSLSILGYYTLEHAYYLAAHKVLHVSDKTKGLLGLWSIRSYAAYVVLQVYKLRGEFKLLKKEEAAAEKTSEKSLELRVKRKDLENNLWLQLYYLPMCLHWSLPNGFFSNPVWPAVLNTLIANAEFRSAWDRNLLLGPIRN